MNVTKKLVSLVLVVTMAIAIPFFPMQSKAEAPTPEQMAAMVAAVSTMTFENLTTYQATPSDYATDETTMLQAAGLSLMGQLKPDSQTLLNITANCLSFVKSLMMSGMSMPAEYFPSTERSDVTYSTMFFTLKGMETLFGHVFSSGPTLADTLSIYNNPYDRLTFQSTFEPTLSQISSGSIAVDRKFGEIIASYATLQKALSNIYYEGYTFDIINGNMYDESIYLARSEEMISDIFASDEEDRSEHYEENLAAVYRFLGRMELNDTGLINDIEELGPYNHYTCGWWYYDLIEAYSYNYSSTSINGTCLSNYPITASQVLAIANNISFSDIANLGDYDYAYFEQKSNVSFDNVKDDYPTFAEYLQNGVGGLLTAYASQMNMASTSENEDDRASAAEDINNFNNHILVVADIEEYLSEITYGDYVINFPIKEVSYSIAAKVATAPDATMAELTEYGTTQAVDGNVPMTKLFDLLSSSPIADSHIVEIVQFLANSTEVPQNNLIAFGSYFYATGLLEQALADSTVNPGEFNLEQTLEMYRILDSIGVYSLEDVTQENVAAMQAAFLASEVTFPSETFDNLLNYAAVLFFPTGDDYFEEHYSMSLMNLLFYYTDLKDYMSSVPYDKYLLNLIEGTVTEGEMIINGIEYRIIEDETGAKGAEVIHIYSESINDNNSYTDYSTDPSTKYTFAEILSMAKAITNNVSWPITVSDIMNYCELDTSNRERIFFDTNKSAKDRLMAFLHLTDLWYFAEDFHYFPDQYVSCLPAEDYPDTYDDIDDSCLGLLFVYQYTKENPLTGNETSLINYICNRMGLSASELYFAYRMTDNHSTTDSYALSNYLYDYDMPGAQREDHSTLLSRYQTVGSFVSAFQQALYDGANIRWDSLEGAERSAIGLAIAKYLAENDSKCHEYISKPAINNMVFDFEKGKVTLIKSADADLIIPAKVPGTSIPIIGIGYAAVMNNDDLHSVTFPNTLQYIDDYAFRGCGLFGGIAFDGGGENCKRIGESAFYCGLSEHWDYHYDSSQQKWVSERLEAQPPLVLPTGIEEIGCGAFEETCITSIVWPEDCKLTEINNWAFQTTYLTEVRIPEGITRIGSGAFGNAYATEAYIPASVEEISSYAFGYNENWQTSWLDFIVDEDNEYYCTYEHALYTKDMKTLVAYPGGRTETEVVIPEGVTRILGEAFWCCQNIDSIVLPDSLEYIEYEAFEGASFDDITLPASVQLTNSSFTSRYGEGDSSFNVHLHINENGVDAMLNLECTNVRISSSADPYASDYKTYGTISFTSDYSYGSSNNKVKVVSATNQSTGEPLTLSQDTINLNNIGTLSLAGLISKVSDLPVYTITIPASITAVASAEGASASVISCTSEYAAGYSINLSLAGANQNTFKLKNSVLESETLPFSLQFTKGGTNKTLTSASTDLSICSFTGTATAATGDDIESVTFLCLVNTTGLKYAGTYSGKVTFVSEFQYNTQS